MRARRLHLLAVALAVALAIAPAASSPAQAKPPGKGAKVAAVSAGLPYVAPWESGFHRYSTQLITPTLVGTVELLAHIPEGQWWRIIYVNGQLVTSAVGGDRIVFFGVRDRSGNFILRASAVAPQPVSTTFLYLFGPHLTSFALSVAVSGQMEAEALPDVLWPPGSDLILDVGSPKAGDQWAVSPQVFAVEVYTPEKEGSDVLVPTPVHP